MRKAHAHGGHNARLLLQVLVAVAGLLVFTIQVVVRRCGRVSTGPQVRAAPRRTVGAGELQLQLRGVGLPKQQLRASLSAPVASVARTHRNASTYLLVHKLRQRVADHRQVSVHSRADIDYDAQQLLQCARAARQGAGCARRVGARACRQARHEPPQHASHTRCAATCSRGLAARVRAPCRPAAASRRCVRRSGGSVAAAQQARQAAAQCSARSLRAATRRRTAAGRDGRDIGSGLEGRAERGEAA